MALQKKLSDEELALIEVLEDPVWLGEFLRSTSDFALNEEERNKRNFEYRWYQKDLLTDKSPNIVLTAGRAVGKCNTIATRVYTYPHGYMRIIDILKKYKNTFFVVPALNKHGEWEQRRAIIRTDAFTNPIRVYTASGYKMDATANHPILTPDGWVPLGDLKVGSLVAIPVKLPSDQQQNAFHWAELRWLGYVLLNDDIHVHMPLDVRFQSQVNDLVRISEYFDVNLEKNRDGSYRLMRKKGLAKHHGSKVISCFESSGWRSKGLRRIPLELKAERNENLKIMLESMFSYRGDFSEQYKVKLRWKALTVMRDIQELLLRLGIETRYTRIDEDTVEIETLDYNAYYQFFKQLDIPGVAVKNLRPPTPLEQVSGTHRFEEIVSMEERGRQLTYAIQVHDHENFICEGIIVHNSVVMEDKLIFNAVNANIVFPETRELVLATANTNQMTPLLDRVTNRFLTSPLLKGYLNGQVNRSKGTLDFALGGGANYRMYARIAGSKGENNMVSVHM